MKEKNSNVTCKKWVIKTQFCSPFKYPPPPQTSLTRRLNFRDEAHASSGFQIGPAYTSSHIQILLVIFYSRVSTQDYILNTIFTFSQSEITCYALSAYNLHFLIVCFSTTGYQEPTEAIPVAKSPVMSCYHSYLFRVQLKSNSTFLRRNKSQDERDYVAIKQKCKRLHSLTKQISFFSFFSVLSFFLFVRQGKAKFCYETQERE